MDTRNLFFDLTSQLIALLKELSSDDWLKSSPIKDRTVKDLVAHLIDGALRKLSVQRDCFFDSNQTVDITLYRDLVQFIQSLNRSWMDAFSRLSPNIMIDLLEYAQNEFNEFLLTLNLDDNALFSVAWAGEDVSTNCFDIAREFTEVWHHQMQISNVCTKTFVDGFKVYCSSIRYVYEGIAFCVQRYAIVS